MTLALIAIIIFLVVWGYQSLDRKEKDKKAKEKTKTNIPLQAEIKKKWEEKLSPEIDIVLPENISLFEYLLSLYIKYDIPFYTWIIDEEERKNWFQMEDRNWQFSEKRDEDSRINKYECIRNQSHKGHDFYELNKNKPCNIAAIAEQEYFSTISDEEIKRRHDIYLAGIRKYNGSFTEAFGSDCPPLPTNPPKELYIKYRTVRQRMFEANITGIDLPYPFTKRAKPFNVTAGNFYYDLIYGLVKKEMYSLGYAASYTGKESEWQEQANKNKEHKEERQKYPWLYD